jgi:hypothetical protein
VVKKPAGTITLSSAEGEALIAQVRQSNLPQAEAGMPERPESEASTTLSEAPGQESGGKEAAPVDEVVPGLEAAEGEAGMASTGAVPAIAADGTGNKSTVNRPCRD